MTRTDQELIHTFISITGASESIAIQSLEEYRGDLNQAVNAHFGEGDRNSSIATSVASQQDDFMDIDYDPLQVPHREFGSPFLSATRNFNPFSLLGPNFGNRLFNRNFDFMNRVPFVSHPREVREIPIEVRNGNGTSNHFGPTPTIEDVTDTSRDYGPEIRGHVSFDEDDYGFGGQRPTPNAPEVVHMPNYNNDVEEVMIRAALEASKREAEENYTSQQHGAFDNIGHTVPQQGPSHLEEDDELAHAVSLSLKTAEQEKEFREQVEKVEPLEPAAYSPDEVENKRRRYALYDNGTSIHSKLEAGSSSIHDDAQEQLLVRQRRKHVSSGLTDSLKDVEETRDRPPSGRIQRNINQEQNNGNGFPFEWGGMSSEEHDEAVMLESALFGGIPDRRGHVSYLPHQIMRDNLDETIDHHPQQAPHPPSPNLTAQRLLREQQDDEYIAALRADREKSEAHRLEEHGARDAELEEERHREEEISRKLKEDQEFEAQLAKKEVLLLNEPASDDYNVVNLLVRMPDGSRRGRRFLKSDNLQLLFDFIDVGKAVKPGTYRLVRPYPRRVFGDGDSASTLNELGLTNKQEALYLELI